MLRFAIPVAGKGSREMMGSIGVMVTVFVDDTVFQPANSMSTLRALIQEALFPAMINQ